MSTRTIAASESETAQQWLDVEGPKRGFGREFGVVFLRAEDGWLHFAVKMDSPGMAVFERARLLRELEDDWLEQHPHANFKLALRPTAA